MWRAQWNEMKGWGALIFGFLVCPCHLPFTLPLAISLTAGTVAGAWLVENKALVWGIFTLLFLAGLGVGFHWLTREEGETQPKRKGPMQVVVLTSAVCASCEATVELWKGLRAETPFALKIVDLNTRQGRRLAGERNILTTPTTLINGRVAFRGTPNVDYARAALKR